jgi:hypothetical protein
MRNLFNASIAALLLVVMVNSATYAQGGTSFTRGDHTYVEDSVFQFRIELQHAAMNSLLQGFEKDKLADKNLQKMEVAGFCFIPIMEVPKNTKALDKTVHFYTNGFWVVLTLWQPVEDTKEVVQTPKMQFYGIGSLEELMNPSYSGNAKLIKVVENSSFAPGLIKLERKKYAPNVAMMKESREFDVVFLDIKTYLTLATGTRYYPHGVRPQEGIVVQRTVSSFSADITGNKEIGHYRSLIFQPLPVPELPSYTSEAAVMYGIGQGCPPYWYERPPSGDKR